MKADSDQNAVPGAPPDVTIEEIMRASGIHDSGKTIDEQNIHPEPDTAHHNQSDGVVSEDPGKKYHLRREIARGGMGIVMEAQDLHLARSVAMKVILNPRSASKQRVFRFIEEARITAQLQHPGIMPIHELGVDKNGNLFYTMKHVAGKTLKEILKELKEGNKATETEYPLRRLLDILQRVCDTVAYAHSNGVIHRDLKPDNIMIGNYGEVLVLDWGLAKILKHGSSVHDITSTSETPVSSDLREVMDSAGDNAENITQPMATEDGTAIGTPGYMAPEQARGQVARMDERSDIYSLGAILYHIIALKPTVRHDKTAQKKDLLDRIRSGQIEPLNETRRATKPLISIATKALSLRPKDRYPTVKKFQSDLSAYMEGYATSAEELNVVRLAKLFLLRHKTATLLSAAILGLIVAAFLINYSARLNAEKADKLAVMEGKRAEKALANLKATAPALISLADYYVQRQEMKKALEIVDRATELVSESPECHSKRGDLLQVLNQFSESVAEYEKALKLKPANKRTSANLDLSRQMAQSNDVQKLASSLWEQERFSEACYVILPSSKKQKPELIKSVIEWMLKKERIQHGNVQVTDTMCKLDLSNSNIRDLSDLKGMPLTHLNLTGCVDIYDLRPLRGMPLKELIDIKSYTRIADLTLADLLPTKDMPLKELILNGCSRITDLSPLKGMRLVRLDIGDCVNITNLYPLKGMPLIDLNLNGCSGIVDFSPLRGMPTTRFRGGESSVSTLPEK